MAKFKGSGVVFLRTRIQAAGRAEEKALLAKLTPEEADAYTKAMAITWIPLDITAALFRKVAEVLYPGNPKGIFELGRGQARDNLSGIYKIILKLTTVPFLAGQSAKLWRTYYDFGNARTELNADLKKGVLIVENHPDLPKEIRELTRGYIAGAMELTKSEGIQVQSDESNPEAWKWIVHWK